MLNSDVNSDQPNGHPIIQNNVISNHHPKAESPATGNSIVDGDLPTKSTAVDGDLPTNNTAVGRDLPTKSTTQRIAPASNQNVYQNNLEARNEFTQHNHISNHHPTAPVHVEDEPTFGELIRNFWRVMRKRWLIIFLIVLLAESLGVLYANRKPDKILYQAVATVTILPLPTRNIGDIEIDQSSYVARSYRNIEAIVKSRTFCKKMLEKTPPEIANPFFADTNLVADLELFRVLNVEQERNSEIIQISCIGSDAKASAYLANLAVDMLIEETNQLAESPQATMIEMLNKQVPDLEQKMLKNRDWILKFEQENLDIILLPGHGGSLDMIGRIKQELQEVNISLISLEIDYQKCQQARKSNNLKTILDLDFFAENQILIKLEEQKAELENKLNEHRLRYTEEHPQIIILLRSVQDIQNKIREHAEQTLRRREITYQNMKEKKTQLEKMLQAQQNKSQGMQKQYLEYERYRRETDALEKNYSNLLEKINEMDLASSLNYRLSNIRRIDRAEIPTEPYIPDRLVYYILSALLGLMLGIACASFLESLDQTVQSAQDLQLLIPNATLYGIIPFMSPKIFAHHYASAVEFKSDSNIAEALHTITTSIFLSNRGTGPQILVISSTLAGEGKTTFACNLALTMSKIGYKTLLIDSDLRRPQLHTHFQLDRSPGFNEVLQNQVTATAAMKEIRPHLFCLTAGASPTNLYENIHTYAASVLQSVQNNFDYILIDTPPLGLTADALILSRQATSMILVVSLHHTPRKILQQIAQRIRALNIPLHGLVINDCQGISTSEQVENYGGYYYKHT